MRNYKRSQKLEILSLHLRMPKNNSFDGGVKSYVVELHLELASIDRKLSHFPAHLVIHMPPLPFLNPIFGLNHPILFMK